MLGNTSLISDGFVRMRWTPELPSTGSTWPNGAHKQEPPPLMPTAPTSGAYTVCSGGNATSEVRLRQCRAGAESAGIITQTTPFMTPPQTPRSLNGGKGFGRIRLAAERWPRLPPLSKRLVVFPAWARLIYNGRDKKWPGDDPGGTSAGPWDGDDLEQVVAALAGSSLVSALSQPDSSLTPQRHPS